MSHTPGRTTFKEPLTAEEKVKFLQDSCRELIPSTARQLRGQLQNDEYIVWTLSIEGKEQVVNYPETHATTLEKVVASGTVIAYYAVKHGDQSRRLYATKVEEF